jgi:hypothetical protein
MGALGVSQFVDLLVGGLAVGCVYSLVALGFAMIMRATSIMPSGLIGLWQRGKTWRSQ